MSLLDTARRLFAEEPHKDLRLQCPFDETPEQVEHELLELQQAAVEANRSPDLYIHYPSGDTAKATAQFISHHALEWYELEVSL